MPDWTVKVLYDGECPFCMREVRWIDRRDRHGRVALEDITAPDFDAAAYGLTADEVHRFLHAVRPDGTVLRGMPAFRAVYSAVGLGWLLAPTGWPVLRWVFDLGYRIFARNRVRLGRLFGRRCDADACALPDRPAAD